MHSNWIHQTTSISVSPRASFSAAGGYFFTTEARRLGGFFAGCWQDFTNPKPVHDLEDLLLPGTCLFPGSNESTEWLPFVKLFPVHVLLL